MINLDQIRSALEEGGIAKLEGLVPVDEARAAQSMVLELAEKHGLCPDGRWIKSPSRFGVPKEFRNALGKLNRSDEFPELLGERLASLIEKLVGAPVAPLAPGQQILFSLPDSANWSIPSDMWHTDLPKFAERATPGLQAFTFLDDIEAHGGATLVVAGSHRLLNQYSSLSSKEVKDHLRKEEFFKNLFDPHRPAMANLGDAVGIVGDVKLQVVELTGRVGDLYLMDLRVLHAPAPNSSEKARIMPTCRFPSSEVVAKLAGRNGRSSGSPLI